MAVGFVLGEIPPALAVAGGAMCLIGVAVTRGPLSMSRDTRAR